MFERQSLFHPIFTPAVLTLLSSGIGRSDLTDTDGDGGGGLSGADGGDVSARATLRQLQLDAEELP